RASPFGGTASPTAIRPLCLGGRRFPQGPGGGGPPAPPMPPIMQVSPMHWSAGQHCFPHSTPALQQEPLSAHLPISLGQGDLQTHRLSALQVGLASLQSPSP